MIFVSPVIFTCGNSSSNSQGETLEEAKENVVEALHMVLETNKILAQKNIGKGVKSHRESLVFA
jgi:predicted RNase H-like HicB family nuclease